MTEMASGNNMIMIIKGMILIIFIVRAAGGWALGELSRSDCCLLPRRLLRRPLVGTAMAQMAGGRGIDKIIIDRMIIQNIIKSCW